MVDKHFAPLNLAASSCSIPPLGSAVPQIPTKSGLERYNKFELDLFHLQSPGIELATQKTGVCQFLIFSGNIFMLKVVYKVLSFSSDGLYEFSINIIYKTIKTHIKKIQSQIQIMPFFRVKKVLTELLFRTSSETHKFGSQSGKRRILFLFRLDRITETKELRADSSVTHIAAAAFVQKNYIFITIWWSPLVACNTRSHKTHVRA